MAFKFQLMNISTEFGQVRRLEGVLKGFYVWLRLVCRRERRWLHQPGFTIACT
jgi:hypothetical protein